MLVLKNNPKIGVIDFKADEDDQARALKCFEKAAEKDHLEAMVELSQHILNQYQQEVQIFDAKLAYSMIRVTTEAPAKQKMPKSDPMKDFKIIKRYLKAGRNQGYPKALELLGLAHCMSVFHDKNGQDEEHNIKKGIEYLTAAAELGSAEAKYLLGSAN